MGLAKRQAVERAERERPVQDWPPADLPPLAPAVPAPSKLELRVRRGKKKKGLKPVGFDWLSYCTNKNKRSQQYERYQEYIHSPAWKAVRLAALERAEKKCELCETTEGLHVHHMTYERLGGERPGDLRVLCKTCHGRVHQGMQPPPANKETRKATIEAYERRVAERQVAEKKVRRRRPKPKEISTMDNEKSTVPEHEHCWHIDNPIAYTTYPTQYMEICCHCGDRRFHQPEPPPPPPGHGRFHPDVRQWRPWTHSGTTTVQYPAVAPWYDQTRNCPCRVENGGSGVCNCTRGSNIRY